MTPTPSWSDPRGDARFEVAHSEGCVVVIAAGEIDLRSAPALRAILEAATRASRHLVIDLESVTFIDSTGMGALVHARRLGCEWVALVNPAAMVRNVLRITQLDRLFPVFESRQDAIDNRPESTLPSS